MKFKGSESSILEFKREVPKNSQIIHTIIGFCNGFGGRIIIGVDDNGTIKGVPDSEVEQMMDTLQESIYISCTPPILPTVYSQRFADKVVVIIEVSAGMNKPYFLSQEGLLHGTYIRYGSNTYKATMNVIEDLQWTARGLSVDTMPVYSSTIEDIDLHQFKQFLKNRKQKTEINDLDSALKHYQVVTTEHNRIYPTTAGLLLFGKNPQHTISDALINCSHYRGTTGKNAISSMNCDGNLFEQFEGSLNFITRHLEHSYKNEGNKHKKKLEIPENAMREAILNAIVHRHYQIPGSIKIAIYDDRLEIMSPGNFPGPLQPTQLEMGYAYVRNHVITKIFRDLGLIEKLGSGLLTIFRSYREMNLPSPSIFENDNAVKCILPRQTKEKTKSTVTDYEQEILRLFNQFDEITVMHLKKSLSISRQTASRILNKMISKGLIQRVGKASATRYRQL